MHKVFYASGFLYNSTSQKILLQLGNDQEDAQLSLFTGKCQKEDDAPGVLQRIFEETLQVKIPRDKIHPIYDYAHHDHEVDHFICYAEVGDSVMKKLGENKAVKWIPLEKLHKLKITPQTKQDITVGQRVINLAERLRAEKELEEATPQT